MNNLKFYLQKALKNNFALGAFNFSNLVILKGIVNGCKELSSPAIISVSESAFKFMGDEFVISLSQAAKRQFPYLFLHLDHGKSVEICEKAINLGFDSVMIDGSSLSLNENIALTKTVTQLAHKKDILVEGELGQIKGIEDSIYAKDNYYTNPEQAKLFVEETDVDMLAVSIGTSHGAYKYKGEQTLKLDILSEIEQILPDFPLVLHGASQIDKNILNTINQFGGDIKNANGVPLSLLQEVAKNHNIVKINTDTDLRLALTAGVRKELQDNALFDPRVYLGSGMEEITQTIKYKIKNILFSDKQI